MNIQRLYITVILILSAFGLANAQLYKLSVYPQSGIWNYHTGQNVRFDVRLTRCDVPEGDAELAYEITEDMMSPHMTGKVKLKDGLGTIDAGTMKQPGFLRCRVYMKNGGQSYEGMATVGFSPAELRPVTQQPVDLRNFGRKPSQMHVNAIWTR